MNPLPAMNKRMIVLVIGLVLAASPIVWMSVDDRAGEKLLAWTSGGKPLK